MTYENPKIQDAIDQTFVSQQEKVNASAFLDAQKDKNARINSEAVALAEASRAKAKGEADGIEFINQALAKANNNPQLIELRQIEVEKARIDKWNGTYPSTVAGAGAQTWVGLSQKDEVAPVAVKK
jgi:regulator of protease activity HflC (stomatin/prohibitin superfamily)